MSESSSSRFQHLLQPIRDLSKNWSIDIAQDLEEYLEELETVTIIFDAQAVEDEEDAASFFPSQSSSQALSQPSSQSSSQSSQSRRKVMNFAEAALLIQGTSMIYSRKVEYLYALVYQTLSHLSQQNQTRLSSDQADDVDTEDAADDANGKAGPNGKTSKSQNQNQLIGGAFAHLVFENPLPIVQELREAGNISLPRDKASGSIKRGLLSANHQNYQAALTLMGSLVPNEKDVGETFKMLSCAVHPSGTLLMDDFSKKYVSNLKLAQRNGDSTMVRLNFDDFGQDDDDEKATDDQEQLQAFDMGDNNPMDEQQEETRDDDASHEAEEHDDNGDDGVSAPMDENDVDTTRAGPTVGFQTPEKQPRVQPFAPIKPDKDPWERLDPFDASDAVVRPFRKEKTYKKPRRVGHSMKTKASSKEDPLVRFQMNALCPQLVGDPKWMQEPNLHEKKFKKRFCKPQIPLLQRFCDEVWQLEAKWSRMLKTLEAQELKSADAVLMTETAQDNPLASDPALPGGADAAGSIELDWDAPLDIGDDPIEDDDEDDDEDDGGIEMAGVPVDDEGNGDATRSSSMTKEALETLLADTQPEEDSYEAICRKHIESFMKGTEKYIRETDLSRKVAEWEDKLSPLLKEQDNHPPFDIHKCGKQIVQKLEQKTTEKKTKSKKPMPPKPTKVAFKHLVEGMEPYQVCRMFLASLQLANSGNVQLVHAMTAMDQQSVPFEMKLLSSSLVHDRQ